MPRHLNLESLRERVLIKQPLEIARGQNNVVSSKPRFSVSFIASSRQPGRFDWQRITKTTSIGWKTMLPRWMTCMNGWHSSALSQQVMANSSGRILNENIAVKVGLLML